MCLARIKTLQNQEAVVLPCGGDSGLDTSDRQEPVNPSCLESTRTGELEGGFNLSSQFKRVSVPALLNQFYAILCFIPISW